MSSEDVQIDTRVLDKIMKALDDEPPMARIGILGKNNMRSEDGPNNAEIGLKHEFGQEGMPIRSFLRVPLIEHMQTYLEKSGAFTPDAVKKIVQEGTITPWIQRCAMVGETIIADGFQTGGFGKWKPSNMKYKKNHQTLVETQQLRTSITSEVVE